MVRHFVAIFLTLTISFALAVPSALAVSSDLVVGKAVFDANCAVCHAGGRNAVLPSKSLKKEDLTKYGKDSVEAVITQLTNGNGAMPAFAGKLDPTQIEDVAAYVLEQADQGWP